VPDPSRLPPMGGLAPEPAASPLWWMMRTDALTFIAAAFYSSEDEAKKHLLEYACKLPPSAWQCRPEFRKAAMFEGREQRFDLAAVGHAFPIYFWREAREGTGVVEIEGNSATYRGPPFWVMKLGGRGVQHPAGPHPGYLTLHVEGDKLVEIRISAIRFDGEAIVAAVRADGGQVDAGLKRLRSLGRLPLETPAALSPTTPGIVAEPVPKRGELDRRIRKVLGSVPSKGYAQYIYIKEVLKPRFPHADKKTLVNLLSGIAGEPAKAGKDKLWQGKPPRPAKVAPTPSPARRKGPSPKKLKAPSRVP
jgi:hypothetical protein